MDTTQVDAAIDAAQNADTLDVFAGAAEQTPRMVPKTKQLMTHSRGSCFKTCRRREFWAYECGIRAEVDSRALRMGSNFHEAIHELRTGQSIADVCQLIRGAYANPPGTIDPYDWTIEGETIAALVVSYDWRWKDCELKVIASEQSFQLPLRNPATGAASTAFDRAGKIDGIVELECGRQAVLESKLLSDSLDDDSVFWRRLQLDQQVSGYIDSARQLGFPADTVLYDVTRKPTISPASVAVTDDLGAKIVLDGCGNRVKTERGQWRQTGDKEKGYALQTRAMTPDEWSKRLLADVAERPTYYFARREIPRLDAEVQEFQEELWELQKVIRDAQKHNRWYRTVTRDSCPYCPYFSLCTSKYNPGDPLPEGFKTVENINPELE